MRRFTLPIVALALASLALAAALSPSAVLKDAEKLDGKEVTVRGKVADFKQKTSRAGKPYFTFKLKEKDAEINVYGQGKLDPALKNDEQAEVAGIFRKLKELQTFSVKNEVDVSAKPGKKYGAKKVS